MSEESVRIVIEERQMAARNLRAMILITEARCLKKMTCSAGLAGPVHMVALARVTGNKVEGSLTADGGTALTRNGLGHRSALLQKK